MAQKIKIYSLSANAKTIALIYIKMFE